jgi:hypothetical protein
MTSFDCQAFVPAPTPISVERRAAPRQRVLLTGVLSDSRREASQTCSVRNVSETGARIQLPGSDLPMSWGSLIVVRDACVYAIEPVWVSGDQAGVKLVSTRSFNGPSTQDMERLRDLWLEKLPRSGRSLH